MTTTLDGFLHALREDPEDRAARLICADWLDERDDPRGEFLRVQCELAGWVPDLPRRRQLQAREADLLAQHGPKWLGQLSRICAGWEYVNGLAHLTLKAADFLSQAGGSARLAVWLRRAWVGSVRLTHLNAQQVPELAEALPAADLSALDLDGNHLDDPSLAPLLCSKVALRSLDLANNRLTDASLRLLADSPLWEHLQELDLRNNGLTNLGVRALCRGEPPPRLRRLDLQGNALDPEVQLAIARWLPAPAPGRGAGDLARLVNTLAMEFALIPPGTFLMGSPPEETSRLQHEGPEHEVTLTRPYYLGVYQVTQSQFEQVMGRNPAGFGEPHSLPGELPVENIGRDDALEFCQRLSDLRAEKKAGWRYRLPTEAEWEHACRAGRTGLATHYGPSLDSTQANFDGTRPYGTRTHGVFLYHTTRVGSYQPNAFGLYDMHGNVWEWCMDWYAAEGYEEGPALDPQGPDSGDRGVVRGGSWHSDGPWCRSAYRCPHGTTYRHNWNGFRVLLEAPAKS
jgi:uncharacterized protein (TIGR02996 family)